MSDRERETLNEMEKILFERKKNLGAFAGQPEEVVDRASIDEIARILLKYVDSTDSAEEAQSQAAPRPDVHSFMGKMGGKPIRMTFKIGEGNFQPLGMIFDSNSKVHIDEFGTGSDDPEEEGYQSEYTDTYEEVIEEAFKIFLDRNKIYKDTFVFLGLNGTVMTLIGDVFRLRNMITMDSEHGRGKEEQIRDKLIDVINQAVISVMMLDEENFEGE